MDTGWPSTTAPTGPRMRTSTATSPGAASETQASCQRVGRTWLRPPRTWGLDHGRNTMSTTATTTTATAATSAAAGPPRPAIGDLIYRFEGQLGELCPIGLFPEGIRFHNDFEARIVAGPFVGGRIFGLDEFLLRPDGVGVIEAPEVIEADG